MLESGRIGITETAPEQLQQNYPGVQTRLDPGEAEALVAAHTADGTLVTDDGLARALASPTLRSPGRSACWFAALVPKI